MKDNRVILQDIASLAGLNKMTVSRHLHDPNQVLQHNHELILRMMKESNYIPNRAPEVLLNVRSETISMPIPPFHNQIFADVLAGIEPVISAYQHQTLIISYEYDAEHEEREVLSLFSCNIDGLILMGKLHTGRMIQYVRASDAPVVELVDINGQYLDIQVGFDNEKVAFEMTQTFTDSGKRSIAFSGSMDDLRDLNRSRDIEKAPAVQGLEAYHLAPKTTSSMALGCKMFQQAMGEKPDIDAIFHTNDGLAVSALLECQAQQYGVPGKMAIAGFHRLEIGRARLQEIASVIVPRFEIGKMTVDALIKRLNGKDVPDDVDLGYQTYYGDTF